MPERGQDLIAPAEILIDGFRLRRRFDDDDFHDVRLLRAPADQPAGLKETGREEGGTW